MATIRPPERTSSLLRALCTESGLTQEEVADRAEPSARAIGDVERGGAPSAAQDRRTACQGTAVADTGREQPLRGRLPAG